MFGVHNLSAFLHGDVQASFESFDRELIMLPIVAQRCSSVSLYGRPVTMFAQLVVGSV